VLRRPGCADIVLDMIAERKTYQDLHESMFDGRYENQKARMVRLDLKRMYIFEEDSLPKGDPKVAAAKAEVLTQGFVAVETEGSKDTARKLEQLTRLIASRPEQFLTTGLELADLERFRKTVNPTVSFAWMAMLTQLPCQRLRYEKAQRVAAAFPKLSHLLNTFDRFGNDEARCVRLLSELQAPGSEKVGPVYARALYEILTEK
jgi:hypothetical protein